MTSKDAEAKHTAGPWFYQATDNSIRTGDRMPIASDIFGERPEIYQANARLIAAAPDLLETLVKIEPTLYNPFEPDNQSADYKLVTAAIKKPRRNPMASAINTFHRHLDMCERCREHPFDLCIIGRIWIVKAGDEVMNIQRSPAKQEAEKPNGREG